MGGPGHTLPPNTFGHAAGSSGDPHPGTEPLQRAAASRQRRRLHDVRRLTDVRWVRPVLGAPSRLAPSWLPAIGSGRGTLLWPLVDALPTLPTAALDRGARRSADITAGRAGGADSVTAVRG